MLVIALLVGFKLQSHPVASAKTLGMRRMLVADCVQQFLLTEFDEQALSGMGESGFDGSRLFPLHSSSQMFQLTTNGNPKEGYLKRFDVRKGRVSLTWAISLKPMGKKIKGGKGSLYSLLWHHGYDFQPARIPVEAKADFQRRGKFVIYRWDKLGDLNMSIIGPSYREASAQEKYLGPLAKFGYPTSRFD